MVADDPSPSIAIIQNFEKALPGGSLDVSVVEKELTIAVRDRWEHEAESRYLAPHGYNALTFQSVGRSSLGGKRFREIEDEFSSHRLDVSLIVAGFDSAGIGHVLSIDGKGSKHFVIQHHSLRGYHVIGSGSPGAGFIMFYKDVGPAMPARMVVYYAIEGKFFGELAHGVGEATDVAVLRHGKNAIFMGPKWVNKDE